MTIQNLHLLPNLFIRNQLRDANRILLETNFITLRTLLYRIKITSFGISQKKSARFARTFSSRSWNEKQTFFHNFLTHFYSYLNKIILTLDAHDFQWAFYQKMVKIKFLDLFETNIFYFLTFFSYVAEFIRKIESLIFNNIFHD